MIPMLSFLEPSRLWLLLLIPALAGLYLGLVRRRRNRRAAIARSMFDLLIPRDRTWLRHVAVALSILSLATLTLAFAKPKAEVSVPVERSLRIRVRARDVAGDQIELEAEGMPARVIQHELDHLDGVLIIDRATAEDRRAAMRLLRGAPR